MQCAHLTTGLLVEDPYNSRTETCRMWNEEERSSCRRSQQEVSAVNFPSSYCTSIVQFRTKRLRLPSEVEAGETNFQAADAAAPSAVSATGLVLARIRGYQDWYILGLKRMETALDKLICLCTTSPSVSPAQNVQPFLFASRRRGIRKACDDLELHR